MKKLGILLIALLLSDLIAVVIAQPTYDTIDEETGLPEEFSKFSEISQNLSEEAQRQEYLKQEWTKILATNKVMGPLLFYTNKFFSFFNPFWKLIFKIEFSWSWAFILSLISFIYLLIVIYKSVKNLAPTSKLMSFFIALIVCVLIGIGGGYEAGVKLMLLFLSDLLRTIIFIGGVTVIVFFYSGWIDKYKKRMEEEETERAKKDIRDFGKIVRKSQEDLSKPH